MEVYARELVAAMRELPDAPHLTVFVNREAAEAREPWLESLPNVLVPVRARRRTEWVRGEQQLLPGLARRAGVDLLHSLGNTAPVRGRFRRVTTVHDLIYLVHPEAHFGLIPLGLRVVVGLGVRASHRIVTGSQSTARDLQQRLHVPADRIDVAPYGVVPPPGGVTPLQTGDGAELRARLELGDRRLLLSASAKRPHKNLPRLLDAVAALPAERRPVLVLPGYPTQHEDELRARARDLGIEGDVRFLGWIPDSDLEGLYALAAAVVVPSLYEGFGLPVLEAMARGVPVASSNRSSLPEVTGDAALLFDPEDVPAMTRAIDTLLSDPATAGRLRAAGPERAREFTWRRTAERTVESYARALGRAPGTRLPSRQRI
jgi:glycosyltransferase involved in cell wall biosynthesis